MRVCLIRLPLAEEAIASPSIGLLSLLSAVKNLRNCSMGLIDFQYLYTIGDISYDASFYRQAVALIEKEKPDVIGIQTLCISHHIAITLAKIYKRHHPKVKIVLGGPHPLLVDSETLAKFPFIDFIVRGEAELSFPSLLQHLDQPDLVKGLTYRSPDNKIVKTPDQPLIKSLDDFIHPDIAQDDLLKKYFRIEPVAHIEGGRGCPFNCTYCSTSLFWRRSLRMRSPHLLLDHILFLHRRYFINDFHICSDNLTADKKWLSNFCGLMKKNNDRQLTWRCFSKIDHLDRHTIKEMAQAGLSVLFIGIESGSPKIQRSISKNNRLRSVYPVIKECLNNDIDCKMSFMMGFPEEKPEDLNATLEMMLNLRILGVADPILNLLSPLPGTAIYQTCKDRLVLSREKGSYSSFSFQSDKLLDLDGYNLIKLHPGIFSSFYNVRTTHISLDYYFSLHLCYLNIFRYFSRSLFLFSKQFRRSYYQIFRAYFIYIKKQGLPVQDPAVFARFLRSNLKEHSLADEVLRFEESHYNLAKSDPGTAPSRTYQPTNSEEFLGSIPVLSKNTAWGTFRHDIIKLYHKLASKLPRQNTAYIYSQLPDGRIKYRKIGRAESSIVNLIDGRRHWLDIFSTLFKSNPSLRIGSAVKIISGLYADGYISFFSKSQKRSPADTLIIFHSKTGVTEQKAFEIKKLLEARKQKVELLNIESASLSRLSGAKSIYLGSPTYYGLPAFEVERSLKYILRSKIKHDQIDWNIFVTCKYPGSGQDALSYLLGIFKTHKVPVNRKLCFPNALDRKAGKQAASSLSSSPIAR